MTKFDTKHFFRTTFPFLAHHYAVLCTYIPTSELSIFYAYMADNVLILMAAHVIISRPKKCSTQQQRRLVLNCAEKTFI